MSFTQLFALSASVLFTGQQPQSVDFFRRPQIEETQTYSFTWSLPGFGKLSETLRSTVKAEAMAGKSPVVVLEDVSHTAERSEPGPKPQNVESDLEPHNLPNGLDMNGNNYIWIMWAAAGYTPDSKVSTDTKYPISWTTGNKTVIVKGDGKIVSIDKAKNRITHHIAVGLELRGRHLSDLELTSVSDLKTGALIQSAGTFGFPGMHYKVKIERQP